MTEVEELQEKIERMKADRRRERENADRILTAQKARAEALVAELRYREENALREVFRGNEKLAKLRTEFRRFLVVCGEGNANGRALDCIEPRDLDRAFRAINGEENLDVSPS